MWQLGSILACYNRLELLYRLQRIGQIAQTYSLLLCVLSCGEWMFAIIHACCIQRVCVHALVELSMQPLHMYTYAIYKPQTRQMSTPRYLHVSDPVVVDTKGVPVQGKSLEKGGDVYGGV